MSTLEDWTAAVCTELAVDRPDTTLILDLAREVAHGVARPAAPLTAYLVGLAVGAGLDPAEAAARVTGMAQNWPAQALPGRWSDYRSLTGPPLGPSAGTSVP